MGRRGRYDASVMYPFTRLFTVTLAILPFGVACSNDSDPLMSVGMTGASTNPSSATTVPPATSGLDETDSSAGGEGDSTTGDSTTGNPTAGVPTTGGDTDGPSEAPYEVCQGYIACIAVTTPNGLPDAQEGFGENSPCWAGSPMEAEVCGQACATGLEQYHEMFPEEMACYVCIDNADCDAGRGEECLSGACVAVGQCGNGLVEDGELCDGQDGCSADCLGGAPCSPLTDVDCPEGEHCYVLENAGEVQCNPFLFEIRGDGEVCGLDGIEVYECEPGLACITKEALAGDCSGEKCCTAYCDLNAPMPCKPGYICDDFFEVQAPSALSYLGFCRP